MGPALAPPGEVLLDAVLPGLVPPDAVLPGEVLLDAVLPGLVPPDAVLDAVPPGWLVLVPFEFAAPDADADADALALADGDADAVAFGWAVWAGWAGLVVVVVVVGSGVWLPHGIPVAVAVVLPVALVFALAEAVAEAVVVALLVAVPVAVADAVLVTVVLSLGLTLLLAGVTLLLAGLVAVATAAALGLAVLASFEGDVELDEHVVVAVARARLLEVTLGPRPPADEDSGLAVPFTPWVPVLLGEEEDVIPTAWPSWTMAWRSGATARAMPTANTTQAPARADRSSPSRQSRD